MRCIYLGCALAIAKDHKGLIRLCTKRQEVDRLGRQPANGVLVSLAPRGQESSNEILETGPAAVGASSTVTGTSASARSWCWSGSRSCTRSRSHGRDNAGNNGGGGGRSSGRRGCGSATASAGREILNDEVRCAASLLAVRGVAASARAVAAAGADVVVGEAHGEQGGNVADWLGVVYLCRAVLC